MRPFDSTFAVNHQNNDKRQLHQRKHFTTQVINWLTSIGQKTAVAISDGDVDLFDAIQIFKNDVIVLVIRLIDIDTLVTVNGARNEFLKYGGLQKSLRAAGILSVVVWEDFWLSKTDIVKSRLSALLGVSERIPARLCQAKRIDKATAGWFLHQNHLQDTVSSKTQYGLFLPERYFRVLSETFRNKLAGSELLVAVVTFSHPRIFWRDGNSFRSFEMIRFSNLLHTTVVGGLAKLLSAFSAEFKPGDIMTYADLEWSDGASYRKLGFREVSDTQPFEFYLDTGQMQRFSTKPLMQNSEQRLLICNLGSRKFVRDFDNNEAQK
jgi:hypothetical protein